MDRPGGRRRRLIGVLALALAGCATTPKRWEPEVSPELRESCRKAPLECRQAAEKLAGSWSTVEEAFGALKAFTAACQVVWPARGIPPDGACSPEGRPDYCNDVACVRNGCSARPEGHAAGPSLRDPLHRADRRPET